jgi:hypothetical protein
MMTRFAFINSLILTLALALALMGHGYAQAQPPVAALYEVVICGENGAEHITVDSSGNPVDHEACLPVAPVLRDGNASAGPSSPRISSAPPAIPASPSM